MIRGDLGKKFSSVLPDPSLFGKYVYHCNAQDASGDIAFSALQVPVGWARDPLANYLPKLSEDIPVTMLYGSKTWMDIQTPFLIKNMMKNQVEIAFIPDSGHHVYIDNKDCFNIAVHLTVQQQLANLEASFPDCRYSLKPKGIVLIIPPPATIVTDTPTTTTTTTTTTTATTTVLTTMTLTTTLSEKSITLVEKSQ